jgi:hypothetical protein
VDLPDWAIATLQRDAALPTTTLLDLALVIADTQTAIHTGKSSVMAWTTAVGFGLMRGGEVPVA